MKPITAPNVALVFLVALSAASIATAQTSTSSSPVPPGAANPNVRHVIGLDAVKRNATGKLTVEDGALDFKTSKGDTRVPVSSVDEVFIGTETTQGGGKTGKVIKAASHAAPYDSGAAVTILLRTKVDILTVSFHDPDGALHGAVFALPIGQAEQMRTQLVQAGAHASPPEK
jgi:hypothetical protein